MPMPRLEWRHNRERLLLPIVVLPPHYADNPSDTIWTEGLLDTGATSTGLRGDLAAQLSLRPKGQRRVHTANGMMMAAEYVFRVGFVCGDYRDPNFAPDGQQPYVLEREILGFELAVGFAYPLLIGMDILGTGDLSLRRTGEARFDL